VDEKLRQLVDRELKARRCQCPPDMAKTANCGPLRRGVKPFARRSRSGRLLRPDLPRGGLTQVGTESSRQAAGTPPAGYAATPVAFSALPRRTTVEAATDYAFRQHRTEIYLYLRRRTKNAEDAEELTQEVFADAALTLSRMEAAPGSLLGLLYTIARRRFADEECRNGHREGRVPLEGIDVGLPAPAHGRDVAHAIHDAIAQLPGEQRRVVCLEADRRLLVRGDRDVDRLERGGGEDALPTWARDAAARSRTARNPA
jgi:Sigma-70 region 2